VFSTVLLQQKVEDKFRGRVFAAEMALLTLTMAASNYVTGEMLDRFHFSPRTVTIAIGVIFLIPGSVWLVTEKRWGREPIEPPGPKAKQSDSSKTTEVAIEAEKGLL
jgi:hypothetical protein